MPAGEGGIRMAYDVVVDGKTVDTKNDLGEALALVDQFQAEGHVARAGMV
jgi:hypothetical protein